MPSALFAGDEGPLRPSLPKRGLSTAHREVIGHHQLAPWDNPSLPRSCVASRFGRVAFRGALTAALVASTGRQSRAAAQTRVIRKRRRHPSSHRLRDFIPSRSIGPGKAARLSQRKGCSVKRRSVSDGADDWRVSGSLRANVQPRPTGARDHVAWQVQELSRLLSTQPVVPSSVTCSS
jgi:hypothetical protein